MRKFSWILALLAALAMVFIGCGESGGSGPGGPGGGETYEYPVETKFIQVTQRSANWHTIDIKAGLSLNKGGLSLTDFYTEDSAHTITVFGRAPGATNVYFAGAQSSGEGGQGALSGHTFAALDKGEFTLTRTFTWAEISRSNDIRINGFDAGIPYINFYEITIVDEDDNEVYALSKDPDVQGKDHGDVILQEDPPLAITWLVGAFGGSTPNAIGKVFDPSTAQGPCCTDCDDGCADCDNGLCTDECGTECCLPPFTLAVLEGLQGGITVTPVGDALPVFSDTTKVAKFEIVPIDPAPANNNNYAPASGITFTWAQAGITNWANIGGKQSVKITYAAVIESGTPDASIKKDATNWSGSGMDLNYPTLAAGPANTLTYTGAQIGASSTGIAITANSWNKPNCAAVYYIKILKVEVLACPDCEEDVCVCLPCNCFCTACIAAEECTIANCGAGCACDCHYWDGAGVLDPITVTIAVPEATTLVQFPTNGNDATQRAAMAMSGDDITFTYTATLTTGFVALTPAQVTKVQNTYLNGGKVIVNIQGSIEGDGAQFRSVLGDVTKTSGWNATEYLGGGANQGATIFGYTTPLNATNQDLKHVLIQCQNLGGNSEVVVTITGITITPVAPAP